MGSEEKKKQKQNKKKNGTKRKESGSVEPQMITDDRFASAQSDPRFMEAPMRRSKVKIDSRFSRVFTDKIFTSSNAPTDKRGKPTKNNKAASSLKHYYRLQKEEDKNEISASDEEGDREPEIDQTGNQTESESEKLDETLDDHDDDDADDGLSFDEASSATTSDSDEEYMDEDEEEDALMPEDDVPDIDRETRRLAAVNLDWGQVRAVDLYVLLSSFLPKEGRIVSVAVYPSEFGLKRMEEEAVRGPVGLFDDEDEDDDGSDDEIDNKKLRAYELSRLRYYYAVVECDSIATADYLYKTCDGVEFERSANKLDLRFIPNSMDFKHQPRDVATEAPEDYEGLDFQTRALQHSNINLTWDEDEPQRMKKLNRKLNDDQLAELELKEFLASDESDTDDENHVDDDDDDDDDDAGDRSTKKGKKRDKYLALIQSGDGSDEDDEGDRDMEITFSSGLEDISKRILEKKDKKSETVWEAYLRKRKEKKKASKKRSKHSSDDSSSDTDQEPAEEPDDFFVEEHSAVGSKGDPGRSSKKGSSRETGREDEASRAELELLTADDNGADSELKGYNLKKRKKSKGKKGKDMADVDYDDPRFSAVFTSPMFAVDPTDPQFKRSAAYVGQVSKKQKVVPRVREDVGESDGLTKKRKEKNEMCPLVKALKMKSKQVALPSSSSSQGIVRKF